MEKVIYIFGAGASISATNNLFPSIKTFFDKAFELNILIDRIDRIEKYNELRRYIKHVYGIDIFKVKHKDIDIEEILTYIQIEKSRDETQFILNVEEQLLQIIREVLIDSITIGESPSREYEYNDFINRIDDNDTIITFNWDTLLDKAFQKSKKYNQYKYFYKI